MYSGRVHKAAAAVLLLVGVRAAWACAPAPHAGDRVAVVEESAVIIWEPAAKTQHFIRRATFRGQEGRDFGFLVPTPAVPKLAAVGDGIFEVLEARTRPETKYVTRKEPEWTTLVTMCFAGTARDTATGAVTSVQVVATEKVAGYDAAVLNASDARELQRWLADNGYAASPDLVEWLDAYVRQRWIITAFKIDPTHRDDVTTSAVKMSFTTERPFFPYREPASQREIGESRSLRIWFVGPERVSGTIGESGTWPAVLRRSQAIEDAFRGDLEVRASVDLPRAARLTAFEDSSSPRPGIDDLFFARAADQAQLIPPPNIIENVVEISVPVDVLALLSVGAFVFVRRARRRKRPNIDAPGAVH